MLNAEHVMGLYEVASEGLTIRHEMFWRWILNQEDCLAEANHPVYPQEKWGKRRPEHMRQLIGYRALFCGGLWDEL